MRYMDPIIGESGAGDEMKQKLTVNSSCSAYNCSVKQLPPTRPDLSLQL